MTIESSMLDKGWLSLFQMQFFHNYELLFKKKTFSFYILQSVKAKDD